MRRITCYLALILSSQTAFAEDWPQWQGPRRNAASTETGLLQAWPEGGPRLAWRIEGLGGGDSAPAVAGGKLYGLSNREGKEIVWALSEMDGKELWSSSLGDAQPQDVPQSKEGPGGTPTVDGDRIFVIGMSGRIACLSAKDGKVLWQKSLKDDFGGTAPMWNFRESPLVDGDKLICTPGATSAMLVALNKTTGEVIWKTTAATSATPSAPAAAANRPNEGERGPRGGQPRANNAPQAAAVAGTEDPTLYISEHWGMTGFNQKLPNGKYQVNLHFAETYQGISAAGQRVFSFTVQGKEFKDFDPFQKAGGLRKAYVESVPVEVTDGELKISFKQQVENPAIKAIEILPQSDKALKPIRINAGAAEPFTDSKKQVWSPDQGFVGGQVNPGTFGMAGGGFGPPGGAGGGGRRGGFGGGSRAGAAYSSVIAIEHEGVRQYVQMTSTALVGVSAESGQMLWQYNKPANGMGINCSTPIYQDGLVFAASAYGAGGGAVKLKKTSDGKFEAEEVYFTSSMQNHHGGMIVIDGALYGANGGNGGGIMTCINFQTGEILWRDRKGPKGALLYADGRLYLRGEEGPIVLIEPSKEGYKEIARFEQPDRTSAPAWAHPIIANGKLYIRDQGLLLCYDVKAK